MSAWGLETQQPWPVVRGLRQIASLGWRANWARKEGGKWARLEKRKKKLRGKELGRKDRRREMKKEIKYFMNLENTIHHQKIE
jgi:hypothetical protein